MQDITQLILRALIAQNKALNERLSQIERENELMRQHITLEHQQYLAANVRRLHSL